MASPPCGSGCEDGGDLGVLRQTDHRVCPLRGWGFLSRNCHISIPAERGPTLPRDGPWFLKAEAGVGSGFDRHFRPLLGPPVTLNFPKTSWSDGFSPPKHLHLFLSVGHVPGLEIHDRFQTLSLQSSDWQTKKQTATATKTPSDTQLPVATEQLLEVTALNRHSNYLPFWRSEVQTGNSGTKTAVLSGCVPPNRSGEMSPLTFSSFYKRPSPWPHPSHLQSRQSQLSSFRFQVTCVLAVSSLPPCFTHKDLGGDRGPPVSRIIQDCLPISTTEKAC